ncbi:DUF1330 domain-containing protein [Methylophilus sp. 5]|uniref:DUF1330 domain-containing protein n=1 Tax=Methylophilus sp. 5 TaxID=1112274 RepID=UPI00048F7ACE|nr:DUF1330 domain-containing protein [Methylophilus sp. 5]
MSAYVVMLREQTTNQADMETYASHALLAREGHAVTPLVRYGALTILEGPAFEGCLIHRFPTVEAAEAWYHSPQYQQAARHRQHGAQYRVFIVEGIDD